MNLLCLLVATIACSVLAQPQRHQPIMRRQTINLLKGKDPGLTVFPTRADRQNAFGIQDTNYSRLVANSKSAAGGGSRGLDDMWAGYVPRSGNPYALYYAGNGRGSPSKAKVNNDGSNVHTTAQLGRPNGVPHDDLTGVLLAMMARTGRSA